MEKLNISQVAELAYVSRSVVSRVLNNHPHVSTEARERVLNVVEKYNYWPSSIARGLATNSTYEIGVLSTRRGDEALANGFWTLLHLGIFEECIRRGYFVTLSFISAVMKTEIHNRILNEHRMDGCILLTQDVTGLVIEALCERKVPTVLVGHDSLYPSLSSVDVDNFSGASRATAHLAGLGHKKIGAMFASLSMQESIDRHKGYRHALKQAGLEMQEAYVAIGDYTFKCGFNTIQRWIEKGLEVSAIFCASDTLAIGAMLALHQAGLSVPDDVALVGFDDLPVSQYTLPPLTTVKQPIYGKGERAAYLLINQIEGDHPEVVHENLEPQLIIRGSCGAAA